MKTNLIRLRENCIDWKDVVYKGVELLERERFVNETYKYKIIDNLNEFGPYMVIAPHIVLLHARPEDGVIKTGLSIMTLNIPVNFGSELNDPVKIAFSLCSKDNKDHMVLLSNLMRLLMSSDDLNSLLIENDIYNFREKLKNFDL